MYGVFEVEDNYYLEKCQLVEVEDKDYKIDNFSAVYQCVSPNRILFSIPIDFDYQKLMNHTFMR